MTIGEAIRMLRGDETQRAAGARVGVSGPHISNMEKGFVGVSLDTIGEIEEAYGFNPYVLAWISQGGDIQAHAEMAKGG